MLTTTIGPEQWSMVTLLFLSTAIVAALVTRAHEFTTLRPMKTVGVRDCTVPLKVALYDKREPIVRQSRLYLGQDVVVRVLRCHVVMRGRMSDWGRADEAVLIVYDHAIAPDTAVAISWEDTMVLGVVEYSLMEPMPDFLHERQFRHVVKVHHAIYNVSVLRRHLERAGLTHTDA